MKVKILHICASLDGGGVEKSIYHYIKALADKEIEFVLVKHDTAEGILEKKLFDLGCKIYSVPPKSKSLANYYKQLTSIFVKESIDVCHCHQGYMSNIPLLISLINGVKVRIAHGHTAFEMESGKRAVYRKLNTKLTKMVATDLFSCSKSSGKWMWKKNFRVIYNAFWINDYAYNMHIREVWRKKILKEDDYLVGCVCRLVPSKNLFFLVDIFREILQLRPNSMLVLIGDGPLKKDLIRYSKKYHILDKVQFTGNMENINEVLNAFDVFVLPTLFEGLGMGYIEAQVNSLHTFATHKKVPIETKISDFMHFIELTMSPKQWAQEIVKYDREVCTNLDFYNIESYNIEQQASWLYKFYRRELL